MLYLADLRFNIDPLFKQQSNSIFLNWWLSTDIESLSPYQEFLADKNCYDCNQTLLRKTGVQFVYYINIR